MVSLSSISLSGMRAAQVQQSAAAHNVVNLNTPNFQRTEVSFSPSAQGGVVASTAQASTAGSALESDMLSQLQAKNAFLANLAVFKTQDKMAGALLDTVA